MSVPDDVAQAVALIHTAPQRVVYAFAGAGSLALFWLHALAGSSRTLLEARDCYAPRSLAELIGAQPVQAVSASTAHALAAWSLQRAAHLAEQGWPLIGLGCSAAIATDRERRGADRAFVAVHTLTSQPRLYGLNMRRGAGRLTQETQVSRLVIVALAQACGGGDP